MERKPPVAKPWLRVLLFLISLQAVYLLVAYMAGSILSLANGEKVDVTSAQTVWQNIRESSYVISLLISITASLITVYFFRRTIDRRSLHSLGFRFRKHLPSAAAGLFLGLFLLGVGTFVLILNGNLQWEDINLNAGQLLIDLVLLLLIALAEEAAFRGYILNNLMQFTNKWVALAVSALLFALFHVNNPGSNLLPVINIFLAGLMLGINYIYTKNLWFGILLHFSWNFYMGCILGYKVSGLQLQSLFQQTLTGNTLLTGGSFGFEGSAIAGVLCILTVVTVGLIYEKKSVQRKGPDVQPFINTIS